jgi:hypothetical protein
MNARRKFTIQAAAVCGLCISLARGQARPEPKPPMAEDVFKNVQVLKGISVNEFMGTMGFFSASLGLNCTDCHISESSGDWGKYADDTALKRTSRMMIAMVNALNKSSFGGRRAVSCYSCHRGTVRPKVIPSLAEQYSAPPAEDPNEVDILPPTRSSTSIFRRLAGGSGWPASRALSPRARPRATTPIWSRCRSKSSQNRPASAPRFFTCAQATAPQPTMAGRAGFPGRRSRCR